jgi:hypothetical protein
MSIITKFGVQYKQQFEEYTSLLCYLASTEKTTYSQRIAKVEQLVEAYVAGTCESPDPRQLDRLSTLIMLEDILDANPHKSRHNEYPILSETQFNRRRFGGRGDSSNMGGETSLVEAEHVGADGRDYRYPNRRKRTITELLYVDEHAIVLNKVRAAQYKLDTTPGAVVKYNLRETDGELTEPFVQKRGIGARWLADMSAVNEITVESSAEFEEKAAA